MQEFKEKVLTLIDRYAPALSERGIRLKIKKRYFEADVNEMIYGVNGGNIINVIDDIWYRKKEEKKYHYEKNRYHCVVITVVPENDSLLSPEMCREYAFVLKKVERAHIGLKPERVEKKEEKVLANIERRILKILKKAKKRSPRKVCKDNFFDAVRYMTPKYGYKKRILGRDTFTWDMIFGISIVALAILSILICYFIGRLR